MLVATPIGNLGDMTQRALDALESADEVLAEDTRRTSMLLRRCGLDEGSSSAGARRPLSYHDHNASSRLPVLRRWLEEGRRVALVTDSGTPGISDPAYCAVRTAIDIDARVEVLPGASALIVAIAGSGLPPDRFAFEGFLPGRRGKRLKRLEQMKTYPGSIVYFCGPHHLMRLLGEIGEVLGQDRRGCVARELTKLHEEYVRGTIIELRSHFEENAPRGEITLIVEGFTSD
jgi:16S rRNA (cytidine1402-2'-O)-methyltransferase